MEHGAGNDFRWNKYEICNEGISKAIVKFKRPKKLEWIQDSSKMEFLSIL